MLLLLLLGAGGSVVPGVRAYASVSYTLNDSADVSFALNDNATNTEANTTNASATEE
jgi:hypothetical protein